MADGSPTTKTPNTRILGLTAPRQVADLDLRAIDRWVPHFAVSVQAAFPGLSPGFECETEEGVLEDLEVVANRRSANPSLTRDVGVVHLLSVSETEDLKKRENAGTFLVADSSMISSLM